MKFHDFHYNNAQVNGVQIEKKMMTLVLNAAGTSLVLIAGGSTCHSHFTSETESQHDIFSSDFLTPFFKFVKLAYILLRSSSHSLLARYLAIMSKYQRQICNHWEQLVVITI